MASTPVRLAASISMHVQVAVLGDGDARLAGTARLDGNAALAVGADAVEGAGDDPGGRRLADAADAGEHVGVGDAAGAKGVASACAPGRPGRSGPRTSTAGICGRGPGRAIAAPWSAAEEVAQAYRVGPWQRAGQAEGWETDRTTRTETRYGCFLPDLTGLARSPSAVSLPIAQYPPRAQPTQGGRGCQGCRPAAVARCRRACAMARSPAMIAPLAYADCPLDRATHLRADPLWIEARRRDPGSVFVVVCRDRNLVAGEPPRAVRLSGAAGVGDSEAFAFLGISRSGASGNGTAWFAVEPEASVAAQNWRVPSRGVFMELRRVSVRLPAGEAAILAYARALMNWHRRHRHCGVCGGPTIVREGGHMPGLPRRRLRHPAFSAHRSGDHRPRHPRWTGRGGVPARPPARLAEGADVDARRLRRARGDGGGRRRPRGPGGSGHRRRRVRYTGSQPWPFPSSLMLAFRASAEPAAEIAFDSREIEDGRWFSPRGGPPPGGHGPEAADGGFGRKEADRGLARPKATPPARSAADAHGGGR